jgi:hypothetical protein
MIPRPGRESNALLVTWLAGVLAGAMGGQAVPNRDQE